MDGRRSRDTGREDREHLVPQEAEIHHLLRRRITPDQVCERVAPGTHAHTTGAVCGQIARLDGVLGGGCLLTQAAGKTTLDSVDVRDILK